MPEQAKLTDGLTVHFAPCAVLLAPEQTLLSHNSHSVGIYRIAPDA